MSEVNKPVVNPELLEAITAMKADNTPENRNKMITLMMRAKFLSPVTIDPPPAVPESGQPVKLEAGSKISFHLITNADNQKFFMAFSDMQEAKKWNKNPEAQTAVLTFDDYASFILGGESDADGYVIDPFGVNLIFTKDLVRSLKEQKELIEKGSAQRTLNKDEPVKVGQPSTLPQELLDALSECMKSMKNISSAYFSLMQQGELQSFLIVVDFEGDKKEVFNTLAEAARPHLMGMLISFIEIDSDLGAHAVKEIAPFYKKRFSLFS